MTGRADEADATYFNPAGLAFQTTAEANLSYGSLLPGLQRGMYFMAAASGAPLRLCSRNAYVAGSLVYSTAGNMAVFDDWGNILGRVNIWRGNAAGYMATLLTNDLGVGIGLKVLHNSTRTPEYSTMGPIGEATTAAVDIAALYRPLSHVSMGAALDNLGPRIVHSPTGGTAELPEMARLGACWTPIDNRSIRLSVLPEFTSMLMRMPSDAAGFWKDTWKALGIEATVFNLVSLRLGYFEDVNNQRGGVMYQRVDWLPAQHYSLWDAITRRDLGQFKRIGLCWGFGIGYKDYIRFDVSNDAAIYDFPTSNWKFSLVANDIAGGVRKLRQGHVPWED